MSQPNIQIIAKIRNPSNTINLTNTSIHSLNSSPFSNTSSPSKRRVFDNNIENYIGDYRNNINNDISLNANYTVFTSIQQSDVLTTSKIPILGKDIQKLFPTKNYLLNYCERNNQEVFNFDSVFNEQYKIERIYNETIKPGISLSMNRKNSCALLFGPVNSGKSFTLQGNSEEIGILHHSVRDLLSLINTSNQINNVHILKASIYTVFNDNIFDLLLSNEKPLLLDDSGNENILDLSQIEIGSIEDVEYLLNQSHKNMITLSNLFNVDLRKKAHIIYSFFIEKLIQDNFFRLSQIDLVELASSDFIFYDNLNRKDEITRNNTLNTISNINNIIASLGQGTPLNYESKLARCLKPTLGRKSENITYIICVHSTENPLQHSYNALKMSQNSLYFYKKSGLQENNEISGFGGITLRSDNWRGTQRLDNSKYIRNSSNSSSNEKKSRNNFSYCENKIQEIEEKIHNLSVKGNNLTNATDNFHNQRKYDQMNVSNLPNCEYSILKSDNIIFREEIAKLAEINKHYEDELKLQRNKNLELVAHNELLLLDKNHLLKETERLRIELEKSKANESTAEESYTIRFQNAIRMKELESENKNLVHDKNKYEIEYKVLNERYSELKGKYDIIEKELQFVKNKQSEEIDNFENKVSKMLMELENLSRENKAIKNNEEKLKQDLNKSERDREKFKEKYKNLRGENTILNSKINEIEREIRGLMIERENEFIEMKKSVENKKTKIDNKQKLIEEMQIRLNNFKEELYKKRFKREEDEI